MQKNTDTDNGKTAVILKSQTLKGLCRLSDRFDAEDYGIDDLYELKALVRKAVAEIRTYTER